VKPGSRDTEEFRFGRPFRQGLRKSQLALGSAVSVSSMLMASGDIYVQVTATPSSSGAPKSVVVLVPRTNIENYRLKISGKKSDDDLIAKTLADPLAMHVFTHRTSFGNFQVAHLFFLTPPPDIDGRLPEFAQSGLQAWIL
jgi:hypothetical protein